MTHMLRKHQNDGKSSSTPPLHRDSRVITKVQPKIRIIHIFAPEIIQTDVANFRELVQRLTGKPSPSSTTTATTTTSTSSGSSLEKNTTANSDANRARNKLAMRPQIMEPIYNNNNNMGGDHDQSHNYHYKPVINVNNKDCFGGYDDHRDNGGFLEVFDGVNDYFMEMGDFSLAPNDNLQTHHQHLDLHMYEDTFHPLSYRG